MPTADRGEGGWWWKALYEKDSGTALLENASQSRFFSLAPTGHLRFRPVYAILGQTAGLGMRFSVCETTYVGSIVCALRA